MMHATLWWSFSMSGLDVATLFGLWHVISHRSIRRIGRSRRRVGLVVGVMVVCAAVWAAVIHTEPHPWVPIIGCPLTGLFLMGWRYHRPLSLG